MTTSKSRATIKKRWERAGIAGIVENMTYFPDPLSVTFAIHFVLSDNDNVRSILSDIYFHLSYILIFFFLIFGISLNLIVAKSFSEKIAKIGSLKVACQYYAGSSVCHI